jgi:hypothetical protein
MDVKIHGGPVITVSSIPGIDRTTQLIVQKKPGSDKGQAMTLEEFYSQFEDTEPIYDIWEETPEMRNYIGDEEPLVAWALPPFNEGHHLL